MKLVASTMLSAAIKQQCSSVLPLLRHFLPDYGEICGTAMNFVFFVWVTLTKIVNTPLDMSAALVLSVYILHLHWHPAYPTRNIAGAGLGQISEK